MHAQRCCRKIDRVRLRGIPSTFTLYTHDCWDVEHSRRLSISNFATIFDDEDVWQRKISLQSPEDRKISVIGGAKIKEKIGKIIFLNLIHVQIFIYTYTLILYSK